MSPKLRNLNFIRQAMEKCQRIFIYMNDMMGQVFYSNRSDSILNNSLKDRQGY